MPPIPSTLASEAQSLIDSIERRSKHIYDVQVPKLRACVGPLAVQQTLAEDLREDTVLLAGQIKSLSLMVEDQTGDKNRKALGEIVADFQTQLDRLRKDTRTALLASKKAIDLRSKSNRDELLGSAAAMLEKERQTSSEKTTDDLLMKANSDVTTALQRTLATMQAELERSVLSNQLLTSSTQSLRATSTQHDTLSNLMYTSKQLVTALEKSDWMDRLLILSGLAFFLLVVAFILKKRIVDRGVRLMFWWTRFIPSFGDDEELLLQAEKGMRMSGSGSGVHESVSVAATPLVSTAAAVVSNVLSSVSISISSAAISASSPSSALPVSDTTSIPPTDPHVPIPIQGDTEPEASSESSSVEAVSTSQSDHPSPLDTQEPVMHIEL